MTQQQQLQLLSPPPYPLSSKMGWENSPPPNRTPAKDDSWVLESVAIWQQWQPQRGWSYCPMVVNEDEGVVLLDYADWMWRRRCR